MIEQGKLGDYLFSKNDKLQKSIIKVNLPGKNTAEIGKDIVIAAGPCAVEYEEQVLMVARAVKAKGGKFIRGGAFKPRTSPYSFQGLGEKGLQYLAQARQETGVGVITEVMDTRDVEKVYNYVDVLQIGSRNMQNFRLLEEVGTIDKPILLKRGMSSTIEEWLLAAEYIMSQGNKKVILCERGIRTFETATRNTLDLSAVPLLKELTHLPVMVDPSHGTGVKSLIPAMSKASLAAGADGLILEVHPDPENARSDGPQSLNILEFNKLMDELNNLKNYLTTYQEENVIILAN